MKNRDLKNMLKESLQMESQMYDLIVELLEKLYPEESCIAKYTFDQNYEFYEEYGCLHSVSYIENQVNVALINKKKHAEKQG